MFCVFIFDLKWICLLSVNCILLIFLVMNIWLKFKLMYCFLKGVVISWIYVLLYFVIIRLGESINMGLCEFVKVEVIKWNDCLVLCCWVMFFVVLIIWSVLFVFLCFSMCLCSFIYWKLLLSFKWKENFIWLWLLCSVMF